VAGDVALEAADRVSFALPLAPSTLDIGDRAWVVLAPSDDDLVEDVVQFAVATAVEPVADGLTGGGRDRRGSGEPREGGFACEPPPMRPADERLDGADRPDSGLLEQGGSELLAQSEQLPLELVGLVAQDRDPYREQAQRAQRSGELGLVSRLGCERAAAGEQPRPASTSAARLAAARGR